MYPFYSSPDDEISIYILIYKKNSLLITDTGSATNEEIKERGGYSWKRPDDVRFPKVWYTFEAQNTVNPKEKVEFIVKDIPKDRYEEVVELLSQHAFSDDPVYAALSMWW